jgi:hypothetical protein
MPDDRTPEERAYDKGVVASTIQTRLDAHAQRLDRINGSIDNTGSELKKLRGCVEELMDEQKTRDRISAALATTVKVAAAKQVTTRTFWLGIAMFTLALAGLYLGAR